MESFRNLKSGHPELVDNKFIYPLLRWSSSSISDISWCNEVNKYLFTLPADISKILLSVGLKDRNPYIKYPKASKETADKTFELKKVLVKHYYGWSEQEFSRNLAVFDCIDWETIARSLGCDNKERKLLGLTKLVSVKQPKKKIPAKKSLFDF